MHETSSAVSQPSAAEGLAWLPIPRPRTSASEMPCSAPTAANSARAQASIDRLVRVGLGNSAIPTLLLRGIPGHAPLDHELDVVWANDAACTALGVGSGQLSGSHLAEHLGDPHVTCSSSRRAECTGACAIRPHTASADAAAPDLKVVPLGEGLWLGELHGLVVLPEVPHLAPGTAGDSWFRTLTEKLPVAAGVSDYGLHLIFVNRRMSDLFGRDAELLRGIGWISSISSESLDTFLHAVATAMHEGSAEAEISIDTPHGKRVLAMNVAPADLRDAARSVIVTFDDITVRREMSSRLAHQATHDELTGLPNRTALYDLLEREGANGSPLGVAFIDLDNFKLINDTMGHSAGDEVLREAARRLHGCSSGDGLAFRLSGDEFVVVAPEIQNFADAARFAEGLMAAIRGEFTIHGRQIFPEASIGVVLSEPGWTRETLLRSADVAMYQAKDGGRNRWAVYDATIYESLALRMRRISDLKRAFAPGRIRPERYGLAMHFQPIVELPSRRPVGVEALLRWKRPTGRAIEEFEDVPPEDILDLASESQLQDVLGWWLLDQANAALTRWDAELGPDAPSWISVNMTAAQVTSASLAYRVRDLVTKGLSPRRLRIELTEQSLASSPRARETLMRLDQLGVRIAIDDFGVGFSSLAYLATLPVSTLKIDRSLITPLHDGSTTNRKSLAGAAMSIANALSLDVVAEGIETESISRALEALGCTYGQGYFYSRPLTMDAVIEYFRH